MTADVIERRAERGTPRGAHGVWYDALSDLASPPADVSSRHGVHWFRLALGSLAVAALLGFTAILIGNGTGPWATSEVGGAEAGAGEVGTEGADMQAPTIPLPIGVEGMRLEAAHLPMGTTLTNEGVLVESTLGVSSPEPALTGESGAADVQVFAHPDAPFAHPILFVERLEGGGFRPWGVNLGDQPVTSLSDQLSRRDDGWTMSAESGLVEVARLRDDSHDQSRHGWQLDFRQGADTVTWQAERHEGEGLWRWLVRISDRTGDNWTTASVEEVDVLGQVGLVVDTRRGDDNEVIWVHDEFVYRLTAGEVQGDTHLDRPASNAVSLLQLLEPAAWTAMVLDTNSTDTVRFVSMMASLLALAAIVVSGGFFLFRRRFALAGVTITVVLGWYAIADNRAWWSLGPVLALIAVWWWFRRSPTSPETPRNGRLA